MSRDYQECVFGEHLAVSAGDATAARDAMHAHLSKLQQRYRGLIGQPRLAPAVTSLDDVV